MKMRYLFVFVTLLIGCRFILPYGLFHVLKPDESLTMHPDFILPELDRQYGNLLVQRLGEVSEGRVAADFVCQDGVSYYFCLSYQGNIPEMNSHGLMKIADEKGIFLEYDVSRFSVSQWLAGNGMNSAVVNYGENSSVYLNRYLSAGKRYTLNASFSPDLTNCFLLLVCFPK